MIRAAKQFRRRLTLTKHKSKLFFCFLEKPQTALVSYLPGLHEVVCLCDPLEKKIFLWGLKFLLWSFRFWIQIETLADDSTAGRQPVWNWLQYFTWRRGSRIRHFSESFPSSVAKRTKSYCLPQLCPDFHALENCTALCRGSGQKLIVLQKWFSGFIVQYLCCESNRLWLMIQDQPHCFCSIESAQRDDRMTRWQPQGDLFPVSSLHQQWQWWWWK